jgi:hypothetical protein
MSYFIIKTLLSAAVIATVTELSEKMPVGSALIKSLPLTSLMVFIIMKYEGRTSQEIGKMSWDIFYMIIPSLILFIVFPWLLSRGWGFSSALGVGILVMSLGYFVSFKIFA